MHACATLLGACAVTAAVLGLGAHLWPSPQPCMDRASTCVATSAVVRPRRVVKDALACHDDEGSSGRAASAGAYTSELAARRPDGSASFEATPPATCRAERGDALAVWRDPAPSDRVGAIVRHVVMGVVVLALGVATALTTAAALIVLHHAVAAFIMSAVMAGGG